MENLPKMNCPLFILHGAKDELVPPTHSQEIFRAYENTSDLVISREMGHSLVYLGEDFLEPFTKFLQKIYSNNKAHHSGSKQFKSFEIPQLLNKVNPNPCKPSDTKPS